MLANAAMAGLVVAVLYEIGAMTVAGLPTGLRVGGCAVAALVAVAVDIRAMRAGGYSVGLRRQTAKGLAHDGSRPWWVTPLFWGLDTGLVWSTFRVSATSWVMLLSAFWTVAPQWSGLVYGTFFGIPLIAAVCTGDPEKFGRPGSSPPTRLVQGLGAALMAVLPVAMVVISIAPA